jgi:hypothetical protein
MRSLASHPADPKLTAAPSRQATPSPSIQVLALPSSAARVSSDLTLMRKRCPLEPGRRRFDAAALADHAKHVDFDVERQVHLLVAEAERVIGLVRGAERGLHHALAGVIVGAIAAVDRCDPLDDRVRGQHPGPAL